MKCLYVMQDRVSRMCGGIFDSPNDETMRRTFAALAADTTAPDYAIFDTVIIKLGVFDDTGAMPCIIPEPVPFVILRGDENEFVEIRKRVNSEFTPVSV